MWAVMKAMRFEKSLKINGYPTTTPKEGPQRFIPVFDTLEQAVAFEKGDVTHIAELEEGL